MTLVPGRRQTLGVISSNVLQRPIALGQKRASLAPRLSMASSGRRLSIFNGGRTAVAADPRPVGSKAFQQDNIRALIKFLTLHQYDREISPKILFAPTRNDVLHIATFLFRHLDPNFSFDPNSQSLSEDFPVFFESTLAYPFKISKRSLQSVGSPHTWPPLLAALVWLIDLITSKEALDQQDPKDIAVASTRAEKVFYDYLAAAYEKFLEGADNFSFMETGLANQFKDRNAQLQDESAEIQREILEVKQEIILLQASRSELAEAQERRRSLAIDVSKYEKLRDELHEYKARLVTERIALEEEVVLSTSQFKEGNTELESLQMQLNNQEMSPADVARIQSEQKSLQQKLDYLQKESEEVTKKYWNSETSFAQIRNELNLAADQYNEICVRVGLSPLHDCRYGHGIDYELKLNLDGITVDDILSGTDMKRIVKPALIKLKQSFGKTLRKQAAEKRRAQEHLTSTTDQRTERIEELQQLQNRLSKLDASYREQREHKNEELRQRLAKLEDIELSTQVLEKSQIVALTESEEELQQAKASLTRIMCQCNDEADVARGFIMQHLEQLAAHKVHIGKTLQTLEDLSQVQ